MDNDNTQYEKVSETSFKSVVTTQQETVHDMTFLLEQKKTLEASLSEVENLIEKGQATGIIIEE